MKPRIAIKIPTDNQVFHYYMSAMAEALKEEDAEVIVCKDWNTRVGHDIAFEATACLSIDESIINRPLTSSIWFNWIHNPPTMSAYFEDNPNEIRLYYYKSWVARYGSGYYFPPATDFEKYKESGIAKDYKQLFIGTINNPNMLFTGDDTIKRKFDKLIPELKSLMFGMGMYQRDWATAEFYLQSAEKRLGLYLPHNEMRLELLDHIVKRMLRWASRIEMFRSWAHDFTPEEFAFYGDIHCDIGEYKKYWKGPIKYGKPSAYIMQKANYIVSDSPESPQLHDRQLNALALDIRTNITKDDLPGPWEFYTFRGRAKQLLQIIEENM